MTNDNMTMTPSGVEVPASDVDQIRKDERKNTVRNILAAVGLFTLATFALGVLQARREAKNSPKE